MRVVIVQPLIPLYEVVLFERLAALPSIELTILADLRSKNQLNQYDPLQHRFAAKHLGTRRLGGVVVRPRLIRTLIKLSPDIVIINGDPRELSQLLAVLWCKVRGIPTGVWSMFHRVGPRRLVTEIYMRVIGRLGDVLLSYGSRGFREQVARGTPAEKIIVLSTAIDEKAVCRARDQVTGAAVQALREQFGLFAKKILIQVVRATAIKRTDVLIRCFASLARQREDVVLVLIGGGPLEGDAKRQAAALGMSKKILFMGPIYEENVLAIWYTMADVFVMATCIGLSVHHAMCYGLPVVTDDNKELQSSEFEVLQDGVNGFAYRSGDCADFVEKVTRLLDDDALRSKFGQNATRRIMEEYTMERKINNFEVGILRLAEFMQGSTPGRVR